MILSKKSATFRDHALGVLISAEAGLQMAAFCASGTHVPERTLRRAKANHPISESGGLL